MLRTFFAAALCGVALSAGAVCAVHAETLTGKAAFGDWSKDKPGVVRHITADDLEAPGATPSASNAPAPVERPADALPKVPAGFKVELVASGIDNPRAIRFAPNGDLFIANSGDNEVLVLRPGAGAKPQVFAGGLDQPYGIGFYPPGPNPKWIYIANGGSIVRFPYKPGDLKAEGKPEVIVDKLPTGGHWTRDLAFSPDGKTMYVAVGSSSNVAEGMSKAPEGGLSAWAKDQPLGAAWGGETGRANVLSFDPQGENRAIFATGIRNCAGLAIDPSSGAPWCAVNERDALGDNVPFDYATHVEEGAFYGWPWYYIGNHEDPRHAGARPDLAGKATIPDVLFQAHSAPLNIAFYQSDAFGPDYKGSAFVTLHGSWNRGTRTGYKVVRLIFKDGKPTGEYEDFMTGFVLSNENVWGRPVGVAVAPDGSLYVSDDGSGSIWRVSKS
jgi:glucose/arabinose dehydrogenase